VVVIGRSSGGNAAGRGWSSWATHARSINTHQEEEMQRKLMAPLLAVALAGFLVAPVSAKTFGLLYAEGQTFRTFGTPAHVDPGTGTDPIYTFTNSTNPDQLSVARYAPGTGSHGGRWAVYHVTWTDPSAADNLITSFEALQAYAEAGQVSIVRDQGADFRCPILPNG
jgi:hypothetical protein